MLFSKYILVVSSSGRSYSFATNDDSRITWNNLNKRKSYLALCWRLQVLRKITRRILGKDGSGKQQIRIILDLKYATCTNWPLSSVELSSTLTTPRSAGLVEYSSCFFVVLAFRRQSSIQGLVPSGSVLPDKGLDVLLIENACGGNTNY